MEPQMLEDVKRYLEGHETGLTNEIQYIEMFIDLIAAIGRFPADNEHWHDCTECRPDKLTKSFYQMLDHDKGYAPIGERFYYDWKKSADIVRQMIKEGKI